MEADENFANGSIFVKNLYDMSVPRREIASGLGAELRELSSDPLGNYVFFHNTDPLSSGRTAVFKANTRTGEVTRAIPSPLQAALPYNIRNPSVGGQVAVDIDNATLTIDADGIGMWVIVETDLPNAETGQLYGYELSTDPSTYGEWTGLRRQVTNFMTEGGHKISGQKVSSDLNRIIFRDLIPNWNGLEIGTFRLDYDLISILKGVKSPYTYYNSYGGSTIGEGLSNYLLGFDKKTCFYCIALDGNYSLNNQLDFSLCDFDLWIIGPPEIRIPLPGNQVMGSVSPEGGRIMFMDDYLSDGVPGGNFNLYVTSLSSMTRIRHGINTGNVEGFVTPGSVFEGNDGRNFALYIAPDADPNTAQQMFAYSPLKPVSDAAEASSAISSKVVYGPEGLYVLGATSPKYPYEGFYQTFSWTPQELLVRNVDGTTSLMDETQITMGWGVVSGASVTYESLPEKYILERDLVNRKIRFIAPHFSEYGLIAPKILKEPSAVDHWPLQD